MSRVGPEPGERLNTSVRRRAGTGRAPGSVLIAVAAWLLALIGGGALFVSFSAQYAYILAVRRQDAASVIEALLLDLLMIVFTLLALGLSRAGQSARAERALILACAAASSYMNVSAADVASPRSVAAYAVAPVALAVVVDRVVAVIRRHVLADQRTLGLDNRGPRRGGRGQDHRAGAAVLCCGSPWPPRRRPGACAGWCWTPLRCPRSPRRPRRRRVEPPRTKKAVLLALYRAHPDYGDRSRASRVAAELAPQAGLQAGNRPQLPVRRAGRQDIMTAAPPADPSPRALGESLAALAVQVADLRGQIRAINERLDQAGLRADLNLAARFEDLAQTVADALDAAAPRGPAAPYWIGLDRDTYHARLADLRRWADTVLRQHYGGYELPELLAPPHPRHLGTVHPGRRMAPHLRRDTPRPGPGPGVLRPVAARHHAPHHRHHPRLHAAVRDAPQPR